MNISAIYNENIRNLGNQRKTLIFMYSNNFLYILNIRKEEKISDIDNEIARCLNVQNENLSRIT